MFNSSHIKELIRLAISEDLPSGDITSELTISNDSRCEAFLLAKEDLVVCGLPIIPIIYECFSAQVELEILSKEGELVKEKAILAKMKGKTKAILSSERIVLNFIQRLSGIATKTRNITSAHPSIKILDTRKTTPGYRQLEKYAVKTGGGVNHRASLSDLIMVKNNHIDANGGDIEAVLKKLYATKPDGIRVEVEVRNSKELLSAMRFKPDIIMLDNMGNQEIKESIGLIEGTLQSTEIEISGGIDDARLYELEKIGVKLVSMGELTNKVNSADIALRISKYL